MLLVLPAQSFSGPSSLGIETIFYCLRFEISFFVASFRHGPRTENTVPLLLHGAAHIENTCHVSDCEFIDLLPALGVAQAT
jgi:hypothetical protein